MPGYEKRLNASARRIDPGQSRQSTQADLGRLVSIRETESRKTTLQSKTYLGNVLTACILDQGQVTKDFCRISLVMYLVYYSYSNTVSKCQAMKSG